MKQFQKSRSNDGEARNLLIWPRSWSLNLLVAREFGLWLDWKEILSFASFLPSFPFLLPHLHSPHFPQKTFDPLCCCSVVRKPITYHTYSTTFAPPCAFRDFCSPIPVFNYCPTKRPFYEIVSPRTFALSEHFLLVGLTHPLWFLKSATTLLPWLIYFLVLPSLFYCGSCLLRCWRRRKEITRKIK